jgi:histidinol-phosphate/aromatic aminotransferase/cobyric acid decarboxylase-like protein/choline kinase
MKAIILAAGYGNRMRPLTDTQHKTLLEVGGRTIIGRIIDALVENGINETVVVTGYREAELKEWLTGHYPDVSFTFVNNPRYRQTNNIYSMALAFESVPMDADVILIESDLIFEPSILKRLVDAPYPTAALVDRYRSGMDGTVVTVCGDRISSVIPPHLQGENFDFSDKYKTLNIYKFSREFCETSFKKLLTWYARTLNDNCYYELILGVLIYMQQEVVHAVSVEGEKWAEVDDPNDLRVAGFTFNVDRSGILNRGFGGYWNFDVLDFCFIRNMYFPTASMISEMRNNLPALIHNYGSRQSELELKLSFYLLVDAQRVVALNGLSQAYPVLRGIFNLRRVLLPAPTFGEYPRMFPNAATYSDNGAVSVKEIEDASNKCDLIVIVNPNNPSGAVVPAQWIYEFSKSNPLKTIFVDESFIEFSGSESIMPMLEKEPLDNVIVGKSLSKSLGVPGIRLGYLYSANAGILDSVRREIPIWNMNSMAEFYMEILLKNRNSLTRSIEQTIADRETFAALLSKVPIIESVTPSGGNFLMVTLNTGAPSAKAIAAEMLSLHAVLLKDVSDKFKDNRQRMRFAVRLPAENAFLAAKLAAITFN